MIVYRGSELYPCLAKLAAVRMGLPREEPKWLKTAAEEGNEHEQIEKRKLREQGWQIEAHAECPKCKEMFGDSRSGYHYEVEVELSGKLAVIVGHSDGRISKDGARHRLEIKSMSQFEFNRWIRDSWAGFPTYARQATAEWHGMDCDQMLYIVKNRNLGTRVEDWLIEPPADMKKIKADILTIESWLASNKVRDAAKQGMALELMPSDWRAYDPSSYECRRCPWQKAFKCVKDIEFGETSKKMLDEAASKWKLADEIERAAREDKEEAKEVFMTATLAKGLKGQPWVHGGIKIDYRHVTRKAYTVKEAEFDQMTITRAKDNGDT